MSNFIDVFERKEIKYRITETQRTCIEKALTPYMTADEYAHSNIISKYFDTPSRTLIARSLEKPLYKEKLRVRSYGNPTPDGQVFVELKKKFKGVVYKRRVSMSCQAAHAWLAGMNYQNARMRYPLKSEALQQKSFDGASLQIAREIEMFRTLYPNLIPSMSISVDRYSLASIPQANESPVRITFDSQIRYQDHFQKKIRRNESPLLIKPTESIMELKVQGTFPLWLTNILTSTNTLPSSFSKYGEAYRICSKTKPDDYSYYDQINTHHYSSFQKVS